MGNRYIPSKLASYIDGNVHVLRAADVGLCSVQSIAGAFRQACIVRGFVSTVKRTGDAIAVQAMKPGEKKRRGPYLGSRLLPPPAPKPPSQPTLYEMTGPYLRTRPGTPEAIELADRLVQLSRAAT